MAQTHSLRRVLILADESADWIVAGLRQLDRLALSLNEFQGEPLVICIFWTPHLDQSQRWVPKDERLTNVAFTTDVDRGSFDLVLGTRLFLYRNPVPQLMEASLAPLGLPRHDEKELWEIYSHHLETFPRSRDGTWEYVTTAGQIGDVERRFLRDSGKSQDGFVSRYVNRPISRAVTRLLLRFSTTPNAWTLLIFPIPIAASLILLHGTYWSFLWGLILFQVFSVLDGCDGEIARAKFLESERGRRLDDLCDILSNILLAVDLGFGLSGVFYSFEGVAAAALMGVNESYLATRKSGATDGKSKSLGNVLYPRHRELVERSGMLFLGERFASWLIQLTKRDVAMLFFVFLAAIGHPAWILHLLFAVTAISLALGWRSRARL
jgi:hypothetical protein